MKKLLLTSDAFVNPKIKKRFLELLGKNPIDVKILFIPTAAEGEEGSMFWVKESEKELINMGVSKEKIVWLNINDIDKVSDLNQYDVIYVCGGNTFYLMYKLRETGLDKEIIKLINMGKTYVGVSAGSVIMGTTILHAKNADKNLVGLKDMNGFGLTDKTIMPHYSEKEEEKTVNFEKENHCKVLRLKDGQALEVVDGVSKIIG